MEYKQELDQYYKEIGDSNLYRLPIEDARGYYRMRLRQMGKTKASNFKKQVIVQAYIQSIIFHKGIETDNPIQLSTELEDIIYNLYQKGVLPIRLGGIDDELNST